VATPGRFLPSLFFLWDMQSHACLSSHRLTTGAWWVGASLQGSNYNLDTGRESMMGSRVVGFRAGGTVEAKAGRWE
jgi:hypothetical protein